MSKKNKNGMDVQWKMYAKETGIQRFFIYSAMLKYRSANIGC